jgi:hexosaminidase
VTIGGYTPVEKVYSYDPIPDSLNEQQGKHVLGAQGNVWTEYMSNDKKVEYMIFPRMSALSEVLWSQKENRDDTDFEKRLMGQFKRYDLWKANYSKAYFDLKTTVLPSEDNNAVLWKLESKFKDSHIIYMNEISPLLEYANPVTIKRSHSYSAALYSKSNQKLSAISQKFFFSKATGKKITLTNPPSKNYPGNGAFTLVNGVQNEKGMARSTEFLGFLGTDCEAIIDLGKTESISNVIVHTLNQQASWIWRPQYVEVFSSMDGQNFTSIKMTDDLISAAGNNATMKVEFNATSTRFVKIVVKNWGEIPQGNPGAGSKAWLFVDEIEIN